MNYQKIYDLIIDRAKNRTIEGYHESHHIIPRCIGGNDEITNLVDLTGREHYTVHLLLVKIFPHEHKLIYSARMMCLSHRGLIRNNREYEWLRKLFIENHPTKTPENREFMSKRSNEMWSNPEYIIHQSKTHKLLWENPEYRKRNLKNVINAQKFITKESRKNSGLTIKKQIEQMTPEQLRERMKNSMWKADPIKRGIAVSKGKKGKKTNQQEIMGKKFASMTLEQFEKHLSTLKSKSSVTQFKRMREKYLNV